jgi:uncharacterized OsmC-like protein
LRASIAACAATVIAMRAATLGIALKSLEVRVDSESDARGLLGLEGVSPALGAMRLAITIGADDVPEDELRALAAWGERQSPVGCTLRAGPPMAVEVSVV